MSVNEKQRPRVSEESPPGNDKGRPRRKGGPDVDTTGDLHRVADRADNWLRRRRDAVAGVRGPLPCGQHRDPIDCHAAHSGPSSYGLDPDDLRAEIRRLQGEGWLAWEIRARFVDPRTVPA